MMIEGVMMAMMSSGEDEYVLWMIWWSRLWFSVAYMILDSGYMGRLRLFTAALAVLWNRAISGFALCSWMS